MLSLNGNILARKLHSMRETPQHSKMTTRHILEQRNGIIPHLYSCHVKMSLTRGQCAWFSTLEERRLSGDVKNLQTVESHQRLNVEKHSQDWLQQWLVGLTDGDGTFNVDRHVKPNRNVVWNLVYKISLSQRNARAIYKAKNILGAGNLTLTSDKMLTLRIRDRELLKKHVFPIFDRIPLLTNKHYDYIRIRKISTLLDDKLGDRFLRDKRIEALLVDKTSRESIAPIWNNIVSNQNLELLLKTNEIKLTKPQVDHVMTLPWLSGFIEAEGSFYITRKDKEKLRYCHAFGLTQTGKGNAIVINAIRSSLKIVAKVKFREPESYKKLKVDSQHFYSIETTNRRNLEYIRELFLKNLLGIKSLDFRIWERSLKWRDNSEKLQKIQTQLRRIRNRGLNKREKKEKNV